MKANLKFATSLAAGMSVFGGIALLGGNPEGLELRLINRLDESVQHRFEDPMPASLGMSRVVSPSSFGRHFQPNITMQRDFTPETAKEKDVIAALEKQQTQVGFYLFGAAIKGSDPSKLDFRALKGPAAITRGTPRPAWYPLMPKPTAGDPEALPDWNAIYPLANRAMKSFEDGGRGFQTTLAAWNIVARPVIASEERCVACHNSRANQSSHDVRLGQAIGGVLYARLPAVTLWGSQSWLQPAFSRRLRCAKSPARAQKAA